MKNSKEWDRMTGKLVSGHYYSLLDEKNMVCFDDGESIILNKKEYKNLKAKPFDMFQNADDVVGFDKQCEDFEDNSTTL